MPFKIVQTIENGAKYLSVVPSKWQTGSMCFFPKTNLGKREQEEHSEPDETFIALSCVLKRDNIENHKQATEIQETMLKSVDSDQSDVDQSSTQEVLMAKGNRTLNKVAKNPQLENLMQMDTPNTIHSFPSSAIITIDEAQQLVSEAVLQSNFV